MKATLRLLPRFELRSHERRFVSEIFLAHSNLWVFRCDQRAFCGDFVLVDMSAPLPDARRVYAVELKLHMRLLVGRMRESIQLANHPLAVAEIAQEAQAITQDSPVQTLVGDPNAVLRLLGRGCSRVDRLAGASA